MPHEPERIQSALEQSGDDASFKLPTKILIQPQVAASQTQSEHMGLLIAGPQNKWTVDLHEALPDAIQTATLSLYENVEIGHSCGDCGLIFRPKVKRIDIEKLSMQATVEIEVGIYDAFHTEIAHIDVVGKSAVMDVSRFSTGVAGYFIPLFGSAVGKNLLTKTSREAFDRAIVYFHEQISEQSTSGALARHWLPKRENRNYEIGDHQFLAERIAIGEGCSIQSDEVRLVKRKYFSETFMATCWGRASFAIDCEYGRCELRDKRFAQNQ